MKKSTTAALFLSPVFLCIVLSLIWIYWISPKVKDFALSQLPKINSMQPYFQISAEDLNISLLKLQAQFTGLEFRFKDDSTSNFGSLKPIKIKNIKAQVDLFSLIVGQLSLSHITIDHLESEQDFDDLLKLVPKKTNDKPELIDLTTIFKQLDEIPIQKITLQNSNVTVRLTPANHPLLRELKLTIDTIHVSQKNNLISIQSKNLDAVIFNKNKVSAILNLNIKADVSANSYSLDQFLLTHGQSTLSLKSTSKDLVHLLTEPKIKSQFNVSLKLDEMKNFIYLFKDQTQRLPQLSGQVKMLGDLTTEDLKRNQGHLQLSTEEVRFENLKFGNAQANSQIKNNHLLIDSIDLEHPAGHAELKNISLQQEKPYEFKSEIHVKDFGLQKMFTSLNLNNIPAEFNADATATCSGQIENFFIHCDSKINARNIFVKTDLKDAFSIAEIDAAQASGVVDMNLNSAKYKADLSIGSSLVQSTGDINFQTGFNMKFSTKALNLSDIKNISSLGLKGVTSGELTTSGTTDYGIIDSQLQIKNLVVDHFFLGDIQSEVKYAKEKLSFLKTTAQLNKTNYSGQIELDFNTSKINGGLDLNPLYLEDALIAIKDRWQLPLTAMGKGHGKIQFSGPLDFWKMSYDLKSEFERGHISNESFSKLTANILSDGEKIDFKNVAFYKSGSVIQISNYIQTTPYNKTPVFNLKVKSSDLKIESIDHLTDIVTNANGQLNIVGTVTSDILTPLITLQTQTKDLKIDTTSLPTSQGELKLTLDGLRFLGQIFGRQLQLDLNIPFKDKEKFFIKAQARDFNPLTVLPFFNLALPPNDTFASLSADIDLHSETSNFNTLYGTINVENVLLQRSAQYMKLKYPSTITFENGLKKMTPLELVGPEQNLKFYLKNGSSADLNVEGRFFLRPLQFLVPFSENISGLAEINALIDLKSSQLNLSGEGLIDNASFSVKGFKYPINDINAYFDFSKSKIIFSEINASLNQTSISGSGQVDIKGPKKIDVQINAESDKLDIEFPPQYQTSGVASIQFFGDWLPYKLKINYIIDEGNITKEFTEEDQNSILTLRPSPYLPLQQLSQKNQSLLLDVTADFTKGVAVKNRILEGIAAGKMHITGSPENPILQGKIDIQQGSHLIFKDKPFEIQLGTVTFNGEYDINPIILINANSRVSDYEINLLIQGPAKNLDIKPSSQPSLSREDIFSLLALGYTSSKNDQVLSSDAQQKQTGLEVLAALSNQSNLNKKLQEKLGLNVQITPSIDSTRNIAVPKVTVSKKLSQKVTTSYSRPLTGDQQDNEVRLQYLLNTNSSFILNYQNQNNNQQNNILQNTKTDTGVGGIDFEYKKEYGE